jgi:hypothetical protein
VDSRKPHKHRVDNLSKVAINRAATVSRHRLEVVSHQSMLFSDPARSAI